MLGAASVYVFGAAAGKLPAQLYDVLARTTGDEPRARLAATLARCWAYAGQPDRAVRFAEEAVARAEEAVARAEAAGDPALLADCLDAALAAHWGPDQLEVRRALAHRLDEVAAHVLDPEARLQTHLWGLQVACETLDVPAMNRQMRCLELLGEELPRALFFAASRRLMFDLLHGRTDTSARLLDVAATAAERASLADAWMVLKAMRAYSAAQAGDREVGAALAAECEALALAEGMTTVAAEAAFLWVQAGRPDRAGALAQTFRGTVLDELPRDVNWLLTLQCVLEAALAAQDREVIERAAALLAPYENRAVINAGAVMFHGVTDDTLARAADLVGDRERSGLLRERALATYTRIGATWWRDRLATWSPRPMVPEDSGWHLHPLSGGRWLVGSPGAATPIATLRGFDYLRELVAHPGRETTALDLVGAGTGVLVEGDVGELADHRALAAYRHRLGELDQELEEADEWADLGRIEAARTERDALLEELVRVTLPRVRRQPRARTSRRPQGDPHGPGTHRDGRPGHGRAPPRLAADRPLVHLRPFGPRTTLDPRSVRAAPGPLIRSAPATARRRRRRGRPARRGCRTPRCVRPRGPRSDGRDARWTTGGRPSGRCCLAWRCAANAGSPPRSRCPPRSWPRPGPGSRGVAAGLGPTRAAVADRRTASRRARRPRCPSHREGRR
ncbi:hypothetical protein NOCA2310001 [metagenome]|uniref:Uncharacterized protein n=1 Tax=metagenome TaxID=256318 RepID=A0A2P2C1E2_9ZZZZ